MSSNASHHALLPQELIRLKRDGQPLPAEEIKAFVQGIADDRISDAQIGAFTMSVFLNGMSREEVVALTTATRDSGHQPCSCCTHRPQTTLPVQADSAPERLRPTYKRCTGLEHTATINRSHRFI